MASIKINGTLESADLLGFPLTLNISQSFTGIGKIKAFQKFETSLKASPSNPTVLPGSVFSSTNKRAYIYIKNTSQTVAEVVNIYVKISTVFTAAAQNERSCSTDCGDQTIVAFHKIATLSALEYMFLPLAGQDNLYIDSDLGAPVVDYLVLEN
tara:strand:+ start:56 stop:517 length:462 start_codon:yes stop_codon:yes gene_type:complete